MTTAKPEHIITLPTAPLVLIPAAGCILVGACWAGVAWLLTGRVHLAAGALLAGAATAGAAIISMLAIRPRRARPITRWPFVFLAGTLLQMLLSLVGGLLIYFASFGDTAGTWACLVVSYWAGLAGLVWVYSSHMKRTAPAGPPPTVSEKAASSQSTE